MRIKTRNMILIGLFSALTAIGAFIKIPVGPVPVTLQYLFTALSGVLLGPVSGALSQLIYVLVGLAGVPVFASGGGPSYILNPSFGYLLGFIIAPYIIGKIVRRREKPTFLRIFTASILGVLIIYFIGVPYMYIIIRYITKVDITFVKAIKIGFLVFIPGDTAKSIITAILGVKIIPLINKVYNS